MSYKTCPDWPALMERAPDLQFKHMTVQEAQMPVEIVSQIPSGLSLDVVEICCDVEHHVVNASHTHPDVVAALAPWTGQPRIESASMVTSRSTTARRPSQSCSRVVEDKAAGAGSGIRAHGAQPITAMVRNAFRRDRWSNGGGRRERRRTILAPGEGSSTLVERRPSSVTWGRP